jgi:hypothetical protein
MAYSKPKGDVTWYKPNSKFNTRPIAYSPKSTSDLIVLLAKDGCFIKELKNKINYDEEAKTIIQKYIDLGYGNLIAKDYFK